MATLEQDVPESAAAPVSAAYSHAEIESILQPPATSTALGAENNQEQSRATAHQDNETLQREHAALQQEHQGLKEAHDVLRQDHSTLQQAYLSLQHLHWNVGEEIAKLRQNLARSDAERAALQRRIDPPPNYRRELQAAIHSLAGPSGLNIELTGRCLDAQNNVVTLDIDRMPDSIRMLVTNVLRELPKSQAAQPQGIGDVLRAEPSCLRLAALNHSYSTVHHPKDGRHAACQTCTNFRIPCISVTTSPTTGTYHLCLLPVARQWRKNAAQLTEAFWVFEGTGATKRTREKDWRSD